MESREYSASKVRNMVCWFKLAETIFYFLTNQDLLHVPEYNDSGLGLGDVVLIGAAAQYMLFLKLGISSTATK